MPVISVSRKDKMQIINRFISVNFPIIIIYIIDTQKFIHKLQSNGLKLKCLYGSFGYSIFHKIILILFTIPLRSITNDIIAEIIIKFIIICIELIFF